MCRGSPANRLFAWPYRTRSRHSRKGLVMVAHNSMPGAVFKYAAELYLPKNSQRVCRMQIVCDGPHSVPQSGQRFSRVRPFAAQVGHKWPVVPRRPRLSIPIPAASEAERQIQLVASRLESVLPRNRSPGVVPRNGSEDAGRESWTAPHRRQRRGQCPLTDATIVLSLSARGGAPKASEVKGLFVCEKMG